MRVRCSAVVGRESELAVLSDALDRARVGVGSAVFLTGAAGIGKSAVARTVVRLAEARGVAPLVGRAVPRPWPKRLANRQRQQYCWWSRADGRCNKRLTSAERLLRRAAELAGAPDGLIAAELLAQVLAAAGRVEEAVEVVRAALAGAAPGTPEPMRMARLTLVLARAAVAAERWDLAVEQLAEVRAGTASGTALQAEATALAAQVAIGGRASRAITGSADGDEPPGGHAAAVSSHVRIAAGCHRWWLYLLAVRSASG